MVRRVITVSSLAAVCIGALALTGCSSSTTSEGIKIGAVIHGLDNPFFVTMQQGMTDAGAEYGATVTVQAPQGNDDESAQQALLESMAKDGYDCVIVDPFSGSSLNQGITEISQQGTPVVNVDTPVDVASLAGMGGKLTSFIGSDNREAGAQAGTALAKALGSSPIVGLIAGPEGNVASDDRIQGAMAALPDAVLEGPIPADWDTNKAYAAAKAMIDKNPDISGFFAANDQMAEGVLKAVGDSGKSIETVSVDGIQQLLDDVKAGTALGTVAQYPYAMGRMGVEACIVAKQGGDVKDRVGSPIVLVTADNVDEVLAASPNPPTGYDDPFAAQITK